MIARTLSTLALWAAATSAIVFGGTFGWTLVLWILASAATYEACALCEAAKLKPMKCLLQIACAIIVLGGWATQKYFDLSATTLSALVAVCVSLLILKNPFDDFWQKRLLPTLILIFAVPFALQFLVSVALSSGVVYSVAILAAAKFSDVGAFVFGKGFGRHKLASKISPKKTWEGAFGGVFSSACVTATFAWGFGGTDFIPQNFTPLLACFIGALIGVVAIVSDLAESVFKRRVNIKDSGGIIPGIGGALDLADSVLMSAPVGAVIAVIFNFNCQ